jgi:hypothetical protein
VHTVEKRGTNDMFETIIVCKPFLDTALAMGHEHKKQRLVTRICSVLWSRPITLLSLPSKKRPAVGQCRIRREYIAAFTAAVLVTFETTKPKDLAVALCCRRTVYRRLSKDHWTNKLA